jgi:hypothetical protein
MRFGVLDINPAKNPAILDTATWDPPGAWQAVGGLGDAYWQSVQEAGRAGCRRPTGSPRTPPPVPATTATCSFWPAWRMVSASLSKRDQARLSRSWGRLLDRRLFPLAALSPSTRPTRQLPINSSDS